MKQNKPVVTNVCKAASIAHPPNRLYQLELIRSVRTGDATLNEK